MTSTARIFRVVLIPMLLICISNTISGATDTIKIGVAGPHTGVLTKFGLPTVRAAELAAEEINTAGGILGQTVELVVMDDRCRPEVAVNVANQLVQKGVVAVIGHVCSGSTKAALSAYKQNDVLVVSPSAVSPALTQSGKYPNFFRTIDADDSQAKRQIDFVLENLQATKIAIIHDQGDYGKGLAEFAKKFLERAGGSQIVLYESVTPGKTDYHAIVDQISRSEADAVIYGGYHPEASKIVSLMRQKNLTAHFISCDGVKDDSFIKNAGRYAEGVYATGPVDNAQNPLAQRAISKHLKKFGKKPGPFFLNAYAAFAAVANAINSAGTTEFEAVAHALRTRPVDTPLGRIQFDNRGDRSTSGFAMYRVMKGRFRALTKNPEFTPQVVLQNPPAPGSAKTPPSPGVSKPLRIEIISPEVTRGIQVVSTEKRAMVTGKALSAAGVVEVMVNNREAQLDEKGNFSARVLLKPGRNSIRVVAMDINETRAAKAFTIVRKSSNAITPPASTAATVSGDSTNPVRSSAYHALVIGIDNYKYLPRLHTARKDAQVVAGVLENDFGFKTQLLLDASRRQILKAINTYRKHAKPSDHFLIYYAGHGEFDKVAQRAYWLPVEASPEDDIDWIIVDTLTSNLRRINANHILVVADSCYSGTLTRSAITRLASNQLRARYLQKMFRKSSRTLIASGGNEPVADGGGQGHSVFALAFIEGLREMPSTLFTAEELFHESIKERVAGNALQTPEYNTIRNSGHNGGDFLFFRRN